MIKTMGGATVHNMDCMEFMRTVPDQAFDLAIVDPPYGVDGDSYRKNQSSGRLTKSVEYHHEIWNQQVPDQEYFNELIRVSKNQIIWGANHFISKIPQDSSCWIVWDKVNGGTHYADCELAWTSFSTAARIFKYRWSGMLQQDMKNKEVRIHPTQKPVALYEWLLDKYAKPGQLILDTHLGSGSNAIACNNFGYSLVACEVDPVYFNNACVRIELATAQQRMFA